MAARRSRDVIDERDYVDVRVREREREHDRDPLARYFQDDRRSEAGALVLRQREVETIERPRHRARSPSPIRYREVIRGRSPSPLPPREREVVDRIEVRDRVYDRERERQYHREPSRGPPQERVVTRVVERERERSPTPSPEREHERIRIVERSRSRAPSISPSPSPPPVEQRQLVRGPVVEREVITHYTDVDHGVIYAPRAPPPKPEPRRERERERDTEIDIYSSRHRTEVDIQESRARPRSRSRLRAPARASEKEVIVRSDRNFLEVDVDTNRQRRSRSAQPPARDRRSNAVAEEARYIESRIDERGRIGEAYNGATKGWTIVDVPPGTEHVRMDGVGGASADVTWQRYNGVRRTRFIPEREGEVVVAPRRKPQEVPRERVREKNRGEHINVQIIEDSRGHSHSRDREIEVEADRRMVVYPSAQQELMPAPRNDMWTEITKDLVSREAMDYLGYDYEETEYFYYILQYLRYEDVQELVQLSDRIRRQRRKESHQSREEIDIDIDVKHGRRRSHSHHRPRREEERVYEHEVVVDHLHPGYYR
ncbi:hypothetical protein SBRCBS47491_009883 [Sporothrix bragantina]|uniref:DUF8035 domain-containing protein n=1 Tax=Sporothrix bragantina TaxID=671064 RepID=A0ABP0CYG1_9PEZI